jgi:hypothetical protein
MNTTPLLKHLEALTLAQATERARRIQDHARRKNGGSLLAVRVLAVTPCGDEEPDTEVVAECEEWQEAIGRGAAHIFARSRFDTAEALVLVAEGRSRTDEGRPEPLGGRVSRSRDPRTVPALCVLSSERGDARAPRPRRRGRLP